jgi:hypothetical protein
MAEGHSVSTLKHSLIMAALKSLHPRLVAHLLNRLSQKVTSLMMIYFTGSIPQNRRKFAGQNHP